MSRILKRTIVTVSVMVVAITLHFCARAEALSTDDAGFPTFAVGRLTIAKMGVFLDKNGAYANQISPNVGPLAKIALANALFKLPVDESLNFEGQAQIFYLAPLTFGADQDTATILPVADAAKLKKNIASIFGEPIEQNGVQEFTVPQPLPLPDKVLLVKVVDGKALLAPSAAVLKQLEASAAIPVATEAADATLVISMPAIKKLYGKQIDSAMQAGAMLASESVDGLKKVSEQLDTINTALWQIGTFEARLSFDKDSKNLNGELAIVPLKETRLAEMLSHAPAGLDGKDSVLLAAKAPINAAFKFNAASVQALLKKFGIKNPDTSENLDRAVFDLFDGETVLAFDANRLTLLESQTGIQAAAANQKMDVLQKALVDMVTAAMKQADALPKNVVYAPAVETVQYKDTPITYRKIGSHEEPGNLHPMTHDENGFMASAMVKGQWIGGVGIHADESIKRMIDFSGADAQVAPELKAAFDAPQPGTLALISAQLLEVLSMFSGDILGENMTAEQIVGGLKDDPLTLSVFVHDGKAGVRGTIPGATAGSLYIAYSRMRRHGINISDLIGTRKKDDGIKAPGNIPAPPPEK